MEKSLLPSGGTRALSQNRRRGRRHALSIPARLVGERAEVAVHIFEMSMHGMGIRSGQAVREGEIFEVRAFDSLVRPGTRVRIISSRSDSEGNCIIGGEVL